MKLLSAGMVLLLSMAVSAQSALDDIRFIQGDKTYTISGITDSISLQKAPFSIRYHCKPYNEKKQEFYAAQIAVLPDLDPSSIDTGHHTKDIPYFEPGSGMAADENNLYDVAFITGDGHHYLSYQDKNDKRVELVSKNKKLLELDWKVKAFYYNEKDVPIESLDMKHLYFVIFIDKNLNDKIDAHELKKVKVNFAP